MSQKPSSISFGVRGTIGTAAQTVATTKYSVGSAFENKYGDRYVQLTVKCNNVFTLYLYGSNTPIASVANTGASGGVLIASYADHAVTTLDGVALYYPIAGFKYVLPVLYQATGADATVTLRYTTFNE